MTDIRSAVARTAIYDGDMVAIRSGANTLTYGELDHAAAMVTGYLAAHGIGEGSRVVVHMARGIDLFPSLLGILGAGAAFVPVDAAMPTERVLQVVDKSSAGLVITDYKNRHVHLSHGTDIATIDDTTAYGVTAPSVLDKDRAAYVLYTSGTTGDPKGVVVGSAGLHRYVNWACTEYQMSAGTGAPLFTSIAFDATLTTLFGPLLAGRSITVVNEDDPVVNLADLLQQAPDFSFVKATPHHVRLLTELLDGQRLESAVRRLIVGGDELDTATVKRWIDICPVPVVNEYGPTETVVGCSVYTVFPDATGELGSTVPIGRAIAGSRLYVLDQNGDQAEPGQVGELFIAGPSADNRYLGQPAATAAKFVPDPFGEPGARMYRTEDLAAVRPDGIFEFHGRSDRQVKVRGVRVELGEIEVAVRTTPGVVEAAACALRLAGGITTVVVYTGEADPHTIRAELLARVPSWVVPARLLRTSVLPTTRNAKVDTAAVAALLLAEDTAAMADVPTDPLIATVTTEFGAVLHGHVTSDTDFYSAGGDSMNGIRLVARLRRLGHDVTAADLTSHPTPTALAGRIAERGTTSGTNNAVAIGAEVELTPAQRDFHSLALPDAGHWNQNVVLRAPAGLDRDQLREAVLRVAVRHEVLRYRYRDGRQTHVGGDPAIDFRELDIAAPAGFDAAVRQANTNLDLINGPLFRVALVRIQGGSDHIVLVAHHLIVDEVSWHVFLDDLVHEYGPTSAPQVEPPAIGFGQWRAELTRFAARPDVQAQRRRWNDVLCQPAGHLPGDTGNADDYSTEHYRRDGLDTETTAGVRAATESADVAVHEVLLGVVVASLTAVFGIEPPRVDVESHGRLDWETGVDASRVMGWCTAVFPVVLAGASTLDLVRSARDALRALPWHGTEFGLLRTSEIAPSRSSRILFNYLGERDRVLDHRLGWTLVDPPPGSQSPPTGRRPYALEFQARTIDGAITWEWRAGAGHSTDTVTALSDRVRLGLISIGGELAADQTIRFADSGLSAAELAAVMDRVSGSDDGARR